MSTILPPPTDNQLHPRIGALFAGYGGLDLAVEKVYGGSVAWYSEIDKGALKILAHRPMPTGPRSSPSTSSRADRPARTCPTLAVAPA